MTVVVDFQNVGTYRKNADKTATLGDPRNLLNRLNENPKLYGSLETKLDLKKGCENFKCEGFGDLFYSFFDYIKKYSQGEKSLKKVIAADFISNRRNLITFASSAFETRYTRVIRALRKDGVIFLCDVRSEKDEPYGDGTGYKFEQYMTLNEHGKPHAEDEKVSNTECVKSVIRTSLKSGNEEVKVFYAAEIDAIDENGDFWELKTTTLNHSEWLRRKALNHYLQSYLGNVPYIIKGQREGDFITEVEQIETDSIPNMGVNWTSQACLDRLFEILHEIKSRLTGDDTALIINMRGTKVSYRPELAESCKFVDPEFLASFNDQSVPYSLNKEQIPMPVEVDIQRVGKYHKNSDKSATPGGIPSQLNEDRKLYGNLNFEMDLNRGCQNFKDEGYGDVYHSFFDYIKKTNKTGTPLKEAIGADFVSNRRILTIFAEYGYFNERREEDIRAIRKNGVIFLRQVISEDQQPNAYGGGFKFEQYMTLNELGEPHDEDEPPSNAECSKVVIRTSLKKEMEEVKVFYTAETDAIDSEGLFVEINTTRNNLESWLKYQSLHHYMQSFFGSVAYIVKGQIRKDRTVKRIDKTWVKSIPVMVRDYKKSQGAVDASWKWDHDKCMEHLFEVLLEIKNQLKYDDEALMIRVRGSQISYEEEAAENCTFVDPRFLEHFE